VAPTDYLDLYAEALVCLAETLALSGKPAEAAEALRAAIERYRRKGNVVKAVDAERRLQALGS
jgi:hypothetical protein